MTHHPQDNGDEVGDRKPLWIRMLLLGAIASVVLGVVGMILIASTAYRLEEPATTEG